MSEDEEKPSKNKRRKLSAESNFEEESEMNESEEAEEYDDEEFEDEDDSNWDSNCYICNKKGNVVCCDGCSKVAHLKCLKLRVVPENEWY